MSRGGGGGRDSWESEREREIARVRESIKIIHTVRDTLYQILLLCLAKVVIPMRWE